MNFIFYTNILSPHQMPWCREFASLVGAEHFLYLAEEPLHSERASMGWSVEQEGIQVRVLRGNPEEEQLRQSLVDCDVLFCSLRRLDLFRQRCRAGKKTFYLSERWLKPPVGLLRMLVPSYYRMCRDFLKLCREPLFDLLPIGYPAVADWCRIRQACSGNPRALLGAESLEGCTGQLGEARPEFARMHLWGYFVEPEKKRILERSQDGPMQIFWCGRMLDWKQGDILVRAAVILLNGGRNISLRLTGDGPEKEKLLKLAGDWQREHTGEPGIVFEGPVPIQEIRQRMQESEVYVLPSNGGEGWGAVVNEALEEGCIVVGTREAGASVTMLREGENGFLVPSGDVVALGRTLDRILQFRGSAEERILRENAVRTMEENWSPARAAAFLLQEASR